MPLYEYRCSAGHVTDHLCKPDARPVAVPCACGGTATYRIGLVAPGIVSGSKTPLRPVAEPRTGYVEVSPGVWEKGTSIDVSKVKDWRCTACAHKDMAVDEPLPEVCPVCAGPVEVYDNPNLRAADWFPFGGYYDNALGVYFHTKKERADYLKANGLRESDDMEIDDRFRAASARRDAEDADIKAMLEEWDDDKERAQAVDRGEIADHNWAKEIMGMN